MKYLFVLISTIYGLFYWQEYLHQMNYSLIEGFILSIYKNYYELNHRLFDFFDNFELKEVV
jgi:hypothetical protein